MPPLERADLDADADQGELLRDHLGHFAGQCVCRSLIRKVEAHRRPVAVGVGVTGLVEDCFGLVRVVVVGGYISLVGPVPQRQKARGRARLSGKQVTDDRLPVDGVSDRAAHLVVSDQRVFQVEAEVLVVDAGLLPHGQAVHPPEKFQRVGHHRVLDQIEVPLSQKQHSRRVVFDDAEEDALDPGWIGRLLVAKVISVSFQANPLAEPELFENKRTRADRRFSKRLGVGGEVGRDDGAGQLERKRREDFRQPENDGVVAACLDRLDYLQPSAGRAAVIGIAKEVVGPLHVARGDRASVVETRVRPQVDDVRRAVLDVPVGRQVARQATGLVLHQEARKKEREDACGIRAGGVAGVQRRGVSFQPDHRIPVGPLEVDAVAAGQRTHQRGKQQVERKTLDQSAPPDRGAKKDATECSGVSGTRARWARE